MSERENPEIHSVNPNSQLELSQENEKLIADTRRQALNQAANTIDHEINNGFGPVIGYADLLLNHPGLSGEAQHLARLLYQSAEALLKRTHQLSAALRSENPQLTNNYGINYFEISNTSDNKAGTKDSDIK